MPSPTVQLSHSPPHHPSPPLISSFTPHQLHAHLTQLHITAVDAQLLLNEDVDGQSALALTHDNLQLLGVRTFGRRQRILDAIVGGKVGKAGDVSKDERAVRREEQQHDRPQDREAEHEKREGGLLSHLHFPRPHTASHTTTQPPAHAHPPPTHELHPRPHSAEPAHAHQPGTVSHASHNPLARTAPNGTLIYPPDFGQYSAIPSLPITPYQPPLVYAPNLAYPSAYALQPYQHEEKTRQPADRHRQRMDGDEDDWNDSESEDGGYIHGQPRTAKGRLGRVESEEETRRRQREERAEQELRWEEEKEETRKEKDEVQRLKLELQRREDEKQRLHHKPARTGRKQPGRNEEEADEEAERLTPSPTRPFPTRPSSAANTRSTPAPPLLSPPPLTPPTHTLALAHVHGYSCSSSTRNNVHMSSNHSLVYPASRLCILQSRDGRQQFFDGHDGLVRSLAQHLTNRNLFASSSSTAASAAPALLVWDAGNVHAKGLSMPLTVADGSVRSVSFSVDGQHLASVSSDAHYTLKLFHWPTAALLASVHTAATSATAPAPPTQLCLWNPLHASHLLTLGKRHLVFWQWRDGKLRGQKAAVSSEEEAGTALVEYETAVYSAKGFACVATSTGHVLVYTDAHSPPRSFSIASHSTRITALLAHKGGLVAALDDGHVLLLSRAMESQKRLRFRAKAIALAWSGENELAVGTRDGKVWRAADVWDKSVVGEDGDGGQLVVQTHWDGPVKAAAVVDERRYVTVGEDGTVLLWDADKRRVEKRTQLGADRAALTATKGSNNGQRALCVAVGEEDEVRHTKAEPASPTKLCVVGTEDGHLHVLSASLRSLYRVNVEQCIAHSKRAVHPSVSVSAITCLSFCPRGHALAVGTSSGLVAVFSLSHSAATLLDVDALPSTSTAAVAHLDWSASASHLLVSTPLSSSHYYNFSSSTRTLTAVPQSSTLSMHSHLFPSLTSPLSFPLAPLLPSPPPRLSSLAVACHPTAGGGSLVLAGSGTVRLYRWSGRCVRRQACREVRGHVGDVRVVDWLGEAGVVSAGSDMAVMQWKLL